MRLLICGFAFLLFSCTDEAETGAEPGPVNGQTPHANAVEAAPIGAKPVVVNGCYQMAYKKDTARLQLQLKDSTITGTLFYHWHQKDWNEGTLTGVLRGDTILADYTFQSEGMTSVREVAFLLRDDALLQGYGNLADHNGKTVFAQKTKLQFDSLQPFIKTACIKGE